MWVTQRSLVLVAWLYCAIVNTCHDAYEDVCVSWPKGHLLCVVRRVGESLFVPFQLYYKFIE